VYFVDYGTQPELAAQVKQLLESYGFATYCYGYNQHQPWNKCKALNHALNLTETPYFFVADVDVVFHPEFIQNTINLTKTHNNFYYKVGFLSETESKTEKPFNDYQVAFESTEGATGLSLFSTQDLKAINGFDEQYHFWGAEDTDVHERLKLAKKNVHFVNEGLFLLHQWHKTYRQKETQHLTQDLKVNGIVQLNHAYLKQTIELNRIKANQKQMGKLMDKAEFEALQNLENQLVIPNKKAEFDAWFYGVLCNKNSNSISCIIKDDGFYKSSTYQLKKILNKKVPEYYTLKQINDRMLMLITSKYHTLPYIYQVSQDLKSIHFKML
jgi:hypothetical protein